MKEKEEKEQKEIFVKYNTEQVDPNLEFVQNSYIDNKPIYRVNIPSGYEIINFLETNNSIH